MSFSLSSITNTASAVGRLFGSSPVTLGSFGFHQFEVPEQITWGGNQSLSIHKLPGGARVIDAMGRDDRAISWSGWLLSADASQRVISLDQIRNAGLPVLLTWLNQSYNVVVSSIEYDHRRVNLIKYRISCQVLSVPAAAPSNSLLSNLTNDLGNALGVDIPGDLAQVSSTLSSLQPVIAAVGSVVGASPGVASILGGLNNATNVVDGLSNLANGQISGVGLALSSVVGGGATQAVGLLTTLGGAVNNANALNQVGGFLGRMTKLASSPSQ